MEWIECRDIDDINLRAERLLAEALSAAIDRKGSATLTLSGGSTPKALYRLLARTAPGGLPWEEIHLLWGDERAVPASSPDSNYRLADDALLSTLHLPEENVHRIRTELGPSKAALDYEGVVLRLCGGPVPALDVVLLGMGPDGHTASLFPGSPQLHSDSLVAACPHAPLPPQVERVTMTFSLLNSAALVLFLVDGGNKRAVAEAIRDHKPEATHYPASLIRPAGRLVWLVHMPADDE